MPVFPTTIAGSLPKPVWLAEPNKLWAPWRGAGSELDEAKRDATLLALKLQEDCGIDVVTDGEQSRQHRGVFDRHGGALGEIWQHWMGRIAQQCHRPLAPARKRRAVVERPFAPLLRRGQQGARRR